jgi:hypothetical protein
MANTIQRNEIRVNNLGIIDKDVVASLGNGDVCASLCRECGSVRQRREVAEEIGNDVTG